MSVISLTQLNRIYQVPEVGDYLRQKQDADKAKRKMRSKKLPWLIAGLAGGGLGLDQLGTRMITTEDRRKLENLSSLNSRMDGDSLGVLSAVPGKDFAGSGQMFYDYVDRASQAASAKVYGIPASDIIKKLRKSPLMRGTSFDMAKADPWQLEQTDDHYKDFEAGPLAAYMHQLQKHDEAFGSSWGASQHYLDSRPGAMSGTLNNLLNSADKIPLLSGLKADILKKYEGYHGSISPMQQPSYPDTRGADNKVLSQMLEHVARRQGGSMDTYREFRSRLDSGMSRFLNEKGITDNPKGADDIRNISASLPHGTEMDLLRKFRGWIGNTDSELSDKLDIIEPKMAEGMAGPARFYSSGGQIGVKLLQDLPKALGAAMLLTSAGLGVNWLWKRLAAKRSEALMKQKRMTAVKALRSKTMGKKANSVRTIMKASTSRTPMKASEMYKIAYEGYSGMNFQTMLPLQKKRNFTEEEQTLIADRENRWIPKIFQSLGDSPAVRLASPGKQSLLWGAGIGVPVALMAAGAQRNPLEGLTAGVSAGAVTGGVSALLAYLLRQQKNESTKEIMRTLPENSTLRDFEADPLITERRNRMQEAAMLAAANGTRISFRPAYGY